MSEEKDKQEGAQEGSNADNKKDNPFAKKQPLRHPLAEVVLDQDRIKINQQLYQILVNQGDALDPDVLRQKYDPYLDQYDFIVGDVSSDHLRLKGFYKDVARTAIDRKEKAIADYLMEYCNPGAPYFILKLLSPVHRYKNKENFQRHLRQRHYGNKNYQQKRQRNFKRHHAHRSRISARKIPAKTKSRHRKHAFVIKKKANKRKRDKE